MFHLSVFTAGAQHQLLYKQSTQEYGVSGDLVSPVLHSCFPHESTNAIFSPASLEKLPALDNYDIQVYSFVMVILDCINKLKCLWYTVATILVWWCEQMEVIRKDNYVWVHVLMNVCSHTYYCCIDSIMPGHCTAPSEPPLPTSDSCFIKQSTKTLEGPRIFLWLVKGSDESEMWGGRKQEGTEQKEKGKRKWKRG